jgi:hypothetical protein
LFTAPDAPVNLQAIEKTPYDMNLTWEHPDITRGRLKRFDVQVKLISSKLRKKDGEMETHMKSIEVETPTKMYSYKVSEFLEFTYP